MWIPLSAMFLVAALFAHSVACRFSPERNRIILFMLTGTIVGVTLIAALYFYCDTASQIIAGTMVYAFCCEVYLFLFASTLTSVSANLLLRLSKRRMTYDEIARVYDSSEMVKHRIERMISTGLIIATEHGSALTRRGRLLLALLQGLRRFFHHNERR